MKMRILLFKAVSIAESGENCCHVSAVVRFSDDGDETGLELLEFGHY